MSEYSLVIELDELDKRLGQFGRRLNGAVINALRLASFRMQRNVLVTKMSGQRLGIVTGTARKSIQPFAKREGETIRAGIATSLNYVRAHEIGFRGIVNVREHTRRLRRPSRQGKTFARVRPHKRRMEIRAKHFMRDAVREEAPGTVRAVLRSLVILAKTGKIPSLEQIGA